MCVPLINDQFMSFVNWDCYMKLQSKFFWKGQAAMLRQKKARTSWKLVEESTNVKGNMCGIVFDKANSCGGTVNRINDYAKSNRLKGFYKFCNINKKTSVSKSLFDKAAYCRSAASVRMRLKVFFVYFMKFVRTSSYERIWL